LSNGRECDVHHQRPPARVFAATLQCTASYRFADGQLVATGALHLGEVTSGKPGTATTSTSCTSTADQLDDPTT
jgi:hypothetical protein